MPLRKFWRTRWSWKLIVENFGPCAYDLLLFTVKKTDSWSLMHLLFFKIKRQTYNWVITPTFSMPFTWAMLFRRIVWLLKPFYWIMLLVWKWMEKFFSLLMTHQSLFKNFNAKSGLGGRQDTARQNSSHPCFGCYGTGWHGRVFVLVFYSRLENAAEDAPTRCTSLRYHQSDLWYWQSEKKIRVQAFD